MIDQFKKTKAGIFLYRFLRRNPLGTPFLTLSQTLQSGSLHPRHLFPAHIRHNAQQKRVLKSFENMTRAEK